jgi:hypothetical protein
VIIGFILLFILSLLGLLLWMPLRLVIDTTTDMYKVEWSYLFSAQLVDNTDGLGIQMHVLFFKKVFSFEKFLQKRAKPKPTNRPSKPPSVLSKHFRPNFKKILLSFDIKRCKVNWDTDDYLLNAYLYPISFFLNRNGKSLNINFEGKRDINLIIENRLGRIIKSFF